METAEAAYLLRQAGTYYSERLEYAEAETFLKHSLDLYERRHADRHAEAAVLYNNFGTLRVKAAADYSDARRMMIRAVAHFKRAPDSTRKSKWRRSCTISVRCTSRSIATKKPRSIFGGRGQSALKFLEPKTPSPPPPTASLAYACTTFRNDTRRRKNFSTRPRKFTPIQPDAAPLERAAVSSAIRPRCLSRGAGLRKRNRTLIR